MSQKRLDAERQQKKGAFLAAYAEMGVVTYSANAAGISRQTHYTWLESDPEYAEQFAAAEQSAIDVLEAEARRRAVEGVERPVGWYKGKPGGSVREYSDTLLIFLLKGARPEKYSDRHRVVDSDLNPQEWAQQAHAYLVAMEERDAA